MAMSKEEKNACRRELRAAKKRIIDDFRDDEAGTEDS